MSAGNAGYATLQVIPSFRGVTAMMNRELAGVMPGVGRQAGASMGGGFAAGFGQKLKVAGPLALTAVAFLKTLNVARDFEARISAVGAVSGATGSQLDQLRSKSLQLGADTAFSASESAMAMEELVKAGVSVEGVMGGAADATVALAAAGAVELPKAAEIAANAMNSFNLTAADMPRIADLVAGAANASAIEVEDFAYSLQMSGAVANLVGFSFEDLAVGITAMGNAGIIGSDAGTSLKTMLMRLEPTTDRAAALMSELGIITADGANKFFDATGEVKSLAEVSGVLQEALRGQTRQQQLATLNVLFGADAIRAAAVLYDEGAAGISNLSAELDKITAEDVAAARLDNLNGSLEELSGSVETLVIKIGTAGIPMIRSLVDTANLAVDFLASPPEGFFDPLISTGRDLVDTGENVIEVLGDLVAAGRPVTEFAAKLAGAGVVTVLTATADIVERTTGLLADHSTVVAVVAGSYIGLKIAAGAAALSSAAMARMSLGLDVVAISAFNATGRVAMFTGGIRLMMANMFAVPAAGARMSAGMAAGVAQTRAAMGGMIAPIGALRMATMGVVAGAFLVGDAWSKSRAQAREAVDDIKSKTDELSTESMRSTANQLREQATAANEARKKNEGWGGSMKGALEIMTPMKNTVADNIALTDEMSKATLDADRAYYQLQYRYRYVAAEAEGLKPSLFDLGALTQIPQESIDSVENWVRRLESDGIDTASLSVAELSSQINATREAGSTATPVTESLASAMAVFGDETASAKDRLDAWKQTVESIFGVEQSVFDATTRWGSALEELTTTFLENGAGIDSTTEKGRENRAALSSAAESALELAEAYMAAGRTDEAAWMLANTRDALFEAADAAGIAKGDMEAYLTTLGLTPRQIETLIQATIDPAGLAATDAALDELARDRVATIQAYYADPATRHFGDYYERERRWGGLQSYRWGGIPQARYANRTMYQWAEPATGGEVFVPKNGIPARSVPHLRTAAGWYNYDLVPKGTVPMAMGGLVGDAGTGTGALSSGGLVAALEALVGGGKGVEFSGDIRLETTDPKRHAIDLLDHMSTELWLHPSKAGG
jgi:TP901 family phage tail tape measure protein